MTRLRIGLVSWLLLFGAPTLAAAASFDVSDFFVRTGEVESLTAPLTVFGGTTTTLAWSGLIEVKVSNVGVRDPSTGNQVDAFYEFNPANPSTPTPTNRTHGLRNSFAGCAAAVECGAPTILSLVRFVDQVGFVTPLANWPLDPGPAAFAVMPYSPAHTYDFVVNIGPIPGSLTLGDGDGGVFDNSGQFDIQLFGVSSATPEPSTILLFGSGLAGLSGAVWRRRGRALSGRKRLS
jgi:hypothetical protein